MRTMRRSGFTLLEMIGALAIMAILAAAVVPRVIKSMDRAAYTKEAADLKAINDALVLQILSTKSIPSETTWAQAVAGWTMRPVTNITTTPRGHARAFLIDAGGWANSLPYTQGTNGATAPTNARVMIVSTIACDLSLTSAKLATANFTDIWNTPEGSKPSTWSAWPGNGADLLIQRINLEPLFHRLILANRDGTNSAAAFSILPLTDTLSVSPGVGWNVLYLDGTTVTLKSNTVVQTALLLTHDVSFVFENGYWRGHISPVSVSDSSGTFAQTAINFGGSTWNFNAGQGGGKGASQLSVLTAFYSFMFNYTLWANRCPTHFPQSGAANPGSLPEYVILANVATVLGTANSPNSGCTGTSSDGLLK
jgi:prepilin-type N-terminal cleavage/methylation domain-containing protein